MADGSAKAQLYQANLSAQPHFQRVEDNAFHLQGRREACAGRDSRDFDDQKVTVLLPFGKNHGHELHQLPRMTRGFGSIHSVQIREIRV
jgi:hypothetical protein